VRAQLRQPRRRLPLRGHSLGADHTGEQFFGFSRPQAAEDQFAGALAGHQTGQPGAAGHQDKRAPSARQQRPYLLDLARIVEDD